MNKFDQTADVVSIRPRRNKGVFWRWSVPIGILVLHVPFVVYPTGIEMIFQHPSNHSIRYRVQKDAISKKKQLLCYHFSKSGIQDLGSTSFCHHSRFLELGLLQDEWD